jgi:hypothetical protein
MNYASNNMSSKFTENIKRQEEEARIERERLEIEKRKFVNKR